jgi:hypothetical protein
VAVACGSCSDATVSPSSGAVSAIDTRDVIAQMAVAFLNRFVASAVSPEACLVDFTDACRGKRDELGDIQHNREYFEIVGARLGAPTVQIASSGISATTSVPCAFDSRIRKCETPGCTLGAFGYVAGTCLLTSVREPSGWHLCSSSFAGSVVTPTAQTFFADIRK